MTILFLHLLLSFCFYLEDISNTRDSVSSVIQTPRMSPYTLGRALYFQLLFRCMDILMKHCFSHMINNFINTQQLQLELISSQNAPLRFYLNTNVINWMENSLRKGDRRGKNRGLRKRWGRLQALKFVSISWSELGNLL